MRRKFMAAAVTAALLAGCIMPAGTDSAYAKETTQETVAENAEYTDEAESADEPESPENAEQAEQNEEPAQTGGEEASTADTPIGTVTVVESVRVRKSASTEAEVLGTAYEGDELELLMKLADGWTRVRYQGQTAYVKSEYVE